MKAGVVLIVLLGAVGVLAAGAHLLGKRRQAEARADFAPPAVVITDPASGTEVPAGTGLVVAASAAGLRPIVRMELWIDGELKQAQECDRPGGISPFYANFDLLVPSEGPHLLFVRAIDTADNEGQSALLNLTGVVKPVEIFQAVPAQAGDTLEGIAASNGIGPGVLEILNPGLSGPLAPGSVVKVPAPADAQAEAKPTETPTALAGSTSIQVPDVAMLQIASDRSAGLTSLGTFIAEPFAGNVSPPAAPTGLQVEVKKCKILVRWNDNADDEEQYYLYMVPVTFQGFSVPTAYLKPSPGTGPAWHELETKASGTFGIWVDAANSYGTRSSDALWVYVPYEPGCAATAATSLDIRILDVSTAADIDKAYCYVSFEDSTEQRFPSSDSFFALQGGKSPPSSTAWPYSIPRPKDNQLDLSGECWGWSGYDLRLLGSFVADFPPETWTGDRQSIQRNAFEIGLSIQPSVPWSGPQPNLTIDPTLPVPYDLREDPPPPEYQDAIYPNAVLRWKWDGDPAKIDGFEVYLNGKPYSTGYPPLKKPELLVNLGAQCGQMVKWQVAVRVGTTRSGLSAPLEHVLPPCQAYLRVSFEEITLWKTDDGWPGDTCDTLDVYFQISVREVTRSFWNTNFVIPMKCGTYHFGQITGGPHLQAYGPRPYEITIPLSPGEDPSAIWIKARFWDSDSWNPDDLVATFAEHPFGAYVPEAGERWGCKEGSCPYFREVWTGTSITDEARAKLKFRFAVYPNYARDLPPAGGFY